MWVYKLANFIYSKAKEAILKGQVNVTSDPLRVVLIDKNYYTPNQSLDNFLSEIPVAAIKKISTNLMNVTCSAGVVDADDVIISDYDGSAFSAVVLYKVGSSDSNSLLLFFIDTATGLPFTGASSTSPVTIVWDNGPNKIISI